MRKALFPMIVSLSVCGAATAALIATTASAEQTGRNPAMIAMITPDQARETAAPPTEAGPPQDFRAPAAGPLRQQICKDLYARQAGELAFLEAKLSLTATQTPLFAHWKSLSLDIAKKRQADCLAQKPPKAGERPSAVEQLSREEDMLKKRLADIQAVRPALASLYDSLTPAQKEEFGREGQRRMAGRLHMMMGMLERRHPGMGPMVPGPMDEPPPPAH